MIFSPKQFPVVQSSSFEIAEVDNKLYQLPQLDADGFEGEDGDLIDRQKLINYFRSLIQKAANLIDISIDDSDNGWLTNLLSKFSSRNAFFDQPKKDKADSEKDKIYRRYLADMLSRAMDSPSRAERGLRFLDIGNQALFTAGFFPESFMRKMGNSGLDYYLSMSHNCYRDAATLMKNDFYGHVANRTVDYHQVLRCISAAKDTKNRTLFMRMMQQRGKVQEAVAN